MGQYARGRLALAYCWALLWPGESWEPGTVGVVAVVHGKPNPGELSDTDHIQWGKTGVFSQDKVRHSLTNSLGGASRAVLEVFMPITVVLAVGLDSNEVEMHRSVWKSSGFFVIGASTVQEAIGHFKAGDFDLVLLGDSLPFDKKERLTYLIRASGSQVPVVCVGDPLSDPDSYADATLRRDPSALLTGIIAIVAERARTRRPPAFLIGEFA